jgi:phage shock protein C
VSGWEATRAEAILLLTHEPGPDREKREDRMTAATHPTADAHDPSLAGARAWFAQNGLSRPRTGRLLAGVSAGVARRYDVNPLVVRVLTVATIVVLSPIVYLAAWILMPQDDVGPTA